jgi:hypothetical protein
MHRIEAFYRLLEMPFHDGLRGECDFIDEADESENIQAS